jgi:Icc protein
MVESPPLTVAQITDTHLFADTSQTLMGCQTARSLQRVLQQLAAENPKPDLLLLTGDLSQDETIASYEQLRTQVAALNLPTYWLPGNHDRLALMKQALSTSPLSAQKTIQTGGWHFILLNSAVSGQVSGELSPETFAWLEHQLERSERPTVVALHHHPLQIGSAWMDKIGLHNAVELQSMLDRYPQVKLVLFGHIHQEFMQTLKGITYLGAPSTGIQFEPLQVQLTIGSQNPGFRILTLYPNGNYSTVVKRVKLE